MSERRGPEYISAQEAGRIRSRNRRKRGALLGLAGTVLGLGIGGAVMAPMIQRAMKASSLADEISRAKWVAAETKVFSPDGQPSLSWKEWVSEETRILQKDAVKAYLKYGVCTMWDFVANKGMTFDGEVFFRESRKAHFVVVLKGWRMALPRLSETSDGVMIGPDGRGDEVRVRRLDANRVSCEVWRAWGDVKTLHSQTTLTLNQSPEPLGFTPGKAISWRKERESELGLSDGGLVFLRLPPWPGAPQLKDSRGRTWRGMAINSIFPMRQFVYLPIEGPPVRAPIDFMIETPVSNRPGLRKLPSKEENASSASLPANFYARSFGDAEMFYFDFLMAEFEGRTFLELMRDGRGHPLPPVAASGGDTLLEDRQRAAKALMRASAIRHELGESAGRNLLSLHWALANALEGAGRANEMRAPLMVVREQIPREALTPTERMELERGLSVLNTESQ